MAPRVLIVDDDDALRAMLQEALERDGFEVVAATNVPGALRHIVAEKFDVLLSDLHIGHAGEGFTIASAMRNIHPEAVTLVLSGYPALDEALAAIRLHVDQVVVKPIDIGPLRKLIREKLAKPVGHRTLPVESVASILEHEVDATVRYWLSLVDQVAELIAVPLNPEARTGHLPGLLNDLIHRLRLSSPKVGAAYSVAAHAHGDLRREQGYTAAMLVEESRILQVSIFTGLQRNLHKVDFSKVLLDVITIADEVDSQLKQTMVSFGEQQSVWSVA